MFARLVCRTNQLVHCSLAVACACLALPRLQAAPVEFRFEAEVASVSPRNGGANLPFAAAIGDTIVATFAFEPAAGGPLYPQSGVLRFEVGGQAVEVHQYLIEVRNESVPDAEDLRGRIADPSNTPIVDLAPGTADIINLTCHPNQGSYCGVVPGYDELSVLPIVHFATNNEPLSSNDLVADVDVWNAFTFREMSLEFTNSATGGATYIGAYIGAVEQVPEPGTISTALIGAVLWASILRARRAHLR